jgi:hypothetical protein
MTPGFLTTFGMVQISRRIGRHRAAVESWLRYVSSYSTGGSAYDMKTPPERREKLLMNAAGIFADFGLRRRQRRREPVPASVSRSPSLSSARPSCGAHASDSRSCCRRRAAGPMNTAATGPVWMPPRNPSASSASRFKPRRGASSGTSKPWPSVVALSVAPSAPPGVPTHRRSGRGPWSSRTGRTAATCTTGRRTLLQERAPAVCFCRTAPQSEVLRTHDRGLGSLGSGRCSSTGRGRPSFESHPPSAEKVNKGLSAGTFVAKNRPENAVLDRTAANANRL